MILIPERIDGIEREGAHVSNYSAIIRDVPLVVNCARNFPQVAMGGTAANEREQAISEMIKFGNFLGSKNYQILSSTEKALWRCSGRW